MQDVEEGDFLRNTPEQWFPRTSTRRPRICVWSRKERPHLKLAANLDGIIHVVLFSQV